MDSTTPMESHIQITGTDPQEMIRCDRQAIEKFLKTLFGPKGSGHEDSPLQYMNHAYSLEESAISSMGVVRVELRLTDDAEKAGKTFAEAAEKFCQHILDPGAESNLKTLTPLGLLGFSTLSDPFKRCWTQACFADYVANGPGLLKRFDTEFDGYLPEWALALSFAVVIRADFGIFCNVKDKPHSTTDVSNKDAITIGSSILEKYTRKLTPDAREQKEIWNTKLKTNLRTIVTKLEEATSLENINLSKNGDQLNPSDDLCNALYEATLADTMISIFNQDITAPPSFLKWIAPNIVGGGLGFAGAKAFTAGGASSGLAKVTTAFAASKAPVVFSSAVTMGAPAVLSVGAVYIAAAYSGWRFLLWKRGSMRRQYHSTEDALLRCYTLVNEAFSFLRCIEVTDSGPLSLRFTNNYDRAASTEFMKGVRMRVIAGEDVEPGTVLDYLREKFTEIRDLLNAMDRLSQEG